MSGAALAWAKSVRAPSSTAKAVLICLADYADADSCAWPAVRKLAAEVQCSESTIQRSLRALELAGLVSRRRHERPDGGETSSRYTLAMRAAPPSQRDTPPVADRHPPGRTGATPPVASALPPYEPPLEPPKELSSADASEIVGSGKPRPAPKLDPEILGGMAALVGGAVAKMRAEAKADDTERAFEAWNELAARLGLPVARKLDADRRKAIRARLADGGLETWMQALAAVEASRHCRGESRRGWKADLDFVCQPKSWRRLLEGSYGRDAGGGGHVRPDGHGRLGGWTATGQALAFGGEVEITPAGPAAPLLEAAA